MYITGQNHGNFYPQATAAGLKAPLRIECQHRNKATSTIRTAPPALNRFHVTASYVGRDPNTTQQGRSSNGGARCFRTSRISGWRLIATLCRYPTSGQRRCAWRGTTDTEAVIKALESGIGVEGPFGWVFMDPATHNLSQYIPARILR